MTAPADFLSRARRAEGALAFMEAALRDQMPPLPSQVKAFADAVRALLAAEPEAKTEPKHTPENCTEGHGGALCDRCFSNVVNASPSPAREYGPCPGYREGQSHAGCDLCGGLGALPVLRESDFAPSPARDEVREAAERLRIAEALLLDVWDSHHREGWEQSETFESVMDRLGDWRWNNGHDQCNPPLRPDPRKALSALAAKGGA